MASHPVEMAQVLLHGHLVGHMWSSQGTNRFELSPEYRELPRRPVLGQVFEERPGHQWKQAQRLPRWFSNLLPEQTLRDLIATEHGINPRNEFRLLVAVGADLPGAVAVALADNVIEGPVGDVRGELARGDEGAARVTGQHDAHGDSDRYLLRFSLAGAQLKLSMMWSGNTLILPGAGELGEHLVKLPSRLYPGVPENEFSMMTWAREAGVNVPDCELQRTEDLGPLPPGFKLLEGNTVYLVRRFDRRPRDSDGDERVHMEDLNQVVDNWPDDRAKYQGARFERLGRIILELCGEDDFLEYVRRLTFCIAIGNEDAHLKNWTIWYPNHIRPRLSPAYDLVSTIQYENLDRGLALKLGGTKDSRLIGLDQMKRLADGTDVDPARVGQTVEETLESMRETWISLRGDLPLGKGFHTRLRDYQSTVPLLRPLVS